MRIPFDTLFKPGHEPSTESVGNDFILIESDGLPFKTGTPFKMELLLVIICTRGKLEGKINLTAFSVEDTGMLIIAPGQIQEYDSVSEDFEGKFLMMSREFLIGLNIEEKYPLYNTVSSSPCVPLTRNETDSLVDFFGIMSNLVRVKENPHRLKVARHLAKAFFYAYYFHKLYEEREKSKNEMLFKKFIALIEQYFQTERSIQFYADRLSLTPKYLSLVIKENSGRSAAEWINHRVILEAKALLSSSQMTVQQISDQLNFPSQSSFGKYFKRATGIPAKEYARK